MKHSKRRVGACNTSRRARRCPAPLAQVTAVLPLPPVCLLAMTWQGASRPALAHTGVSDVQEWLARHTLRNDYRPKHGAGSQGKVLRGTGARFVLLGGAGLL